MKILLASLTLLASSLLYAAAGGNGGNGADGGIGIDGGHGGQGGDAGCGQPGQNGQDGALGQNGRDGRDGCNCLPEQNPKKANDKHEPPECEPSVSEDSP